MAKAEGDHATALRENEARPAPNFDAAVFHAQQCAEKYLKARLVEASLDFPKTHDLSVILILPPGAPLEAGFRVVSKDHADYLLETCRPPVGVAIGKSIGAGPSV